MPNALSSQAPAAAASMQPSNLLPALFERQDESRPLTVLHIGAALPETVDFFSDYRCSLHFVDLFSELPIEETEEDELSIHQQFEQQMRFPLDTKFDICLFWDIFNFLNRDAIFAFLRQIKPYFHTYTLGHGFVAHSLDKPQNDHLYGINKTDEISLRHRPSLLPAYAPYNQSKLKELLHCLRIDRSVLLSDSRLELLLRAKL
jgi:hypothetical protein